MTDLCTLFMITHPSIRVLPTGVGAVVLVRQALLACVVRSKISSGGWFISCLSARTYDLIIPNPNSVHKSPAGP